MFGEFLGVSFVLWVLLVIIGMNFHQFLPVWFALFGLNVAYFGYRFSTSALTYLKIKLYQLNNKKD